jgi:hypothetical protein
MVLRDAVRVVRINAHDPSDSSYQLPQLFTHKANKKFGASLTQVPETRAEGLPRVPVGDVHPRPITLF